MAKASTFINLPVTAEDEISALFQGIYEDGLEALRKHFTNN